MNTDTDEHIREAIAERASSWYLRHRDGALTAAEKEEFLCWLRASLQHTREYLAVAQLSRGLPRALADLRLSSKDLAHRTAEESTASVTPLRHAAYRYPSRWRRTAFIGLTAASILGALALYWITPVGMPGVPKSIAASHGEQRTLTLRDGSVIHVNASSRVRVVFSRDERLVELDYGQALFEVARDAARPFRVRAGTTDVVAVGTQFDVYRRDPARLIVTVVQGKVDVIGGAAASTHPIRLQAGEQLKLDRRSTPPQAMPVDVRVATAWVHREIVFEGRPLAEVAAEFNRYIPVPVEIEAPALRNLEVSGVFNAYDSDSFLVFLQQYDVEVLREPDRILVRPTR